MLGALALCRLATTRSVHAEGASQHAVGKIGPLGGGANLPTGGSTQVARDAALPVSLRHQL